MANLLEQLTRLLQVSASELHSLIAQGILPVIEEQAGTRLVIVRYLRHLQSISKAPSEDETESLSHERQRLMHVQANRLELIRDGLRGIEVLLLEVLESWLTLSQTYRGGIQAIASRCTSTLTGLSLSTCEELINHECTHIKQQSQASWGQLTQSARRLQPA